MKTKFLSILVICILVLAGFVMLWNFGTENINVQGATLYVGSDSTYKTIQEAIDNATSGDTIYVKNETYYESVLVNKSNIELVGNSTTDCQIIHYYDGSSTIDFAAGINITASNVNVTGFNITVSGNYTFGIYLAIGTSYANIIGNNITTTAGIHDYGIYLYQAQHNNITDNTVDTSGQNAYGIFLEQNSDNNNILDNNVSCNGTFAVGIRVLSSSYNDFDNNKINTTISARYAIYLWSASNYNNITNNEINTSGIFGYGVCVGSSSNNDVMDNEITTYKPDGIGIIVTQKSYYNDIMDNTVMTYGSKGYGVYLNSEADFNNLTNNEIETLNWWSHGIYINPASINNSIMNNTINISGNSAHGIYIKASSNASKIVNNTFNIKGNFTHGLLIQTSNNTWVENCEISTTNNNAFGVYLDGNFASFVNTSILAAEKDFYITNYGNLSAINCSFNDSKVDVEQDGGGVVQVKNFLTIQAYYDDTVTPIPGADIQVKDGGFVVYNTSGYGGTKPQTDLNGMVENIISSDRWFYYNNVSVEITNNVGVKKTNAASWERMRDVDMNTSHTEIFIATDIIGPNIPTGLKVVQITPGIYDVNISWDPNTDDTVKYSVYKFNFSNFQWEILVNVTHPTNWTHDLDLLDGMTHWYRVGAWDENDYPSGLSGSASISFPDLTPPAVPSGLTVTPVPGGDALNVTWDANTDDTIKYEFWYFNPHAQEWFKIANLSQPKNWFLFEYGDLINGTKYFFRVRAYDNAGLNSSYAVANGTHRDYLAPVAPTDLMAETISETSIYLSWNRSTDLDIEGYRIYINQSGAGAGGPYMLNDVVDGGTMDFEVKNLWENETYYFVVLAADEANNTSPFTNESVNTTTNVAPLRPTIDTLPELTNNTKLNVTGTALNASGIPEYMATVRVYNDNQFAGEGLVNSTGGFKIEITLEEGGNPITAMVIDRADNPSELTDPISVVLDTQKPVVVLDAFVDYTNDPIFYVSGQTENESKVFIYNNDVLTASGVAGSDGRFKIQITLVEGENAVTATALDPAQNNGSQTLPRIVILDLTNPVAIAGNDINIYTGENATFNGSGSTDNWVIVNYSWSFDYEGNEVTLYGNMVEFSFGLQNDYEVTLTVTDGAGNSDTDMLWVVVSEPTADTEPPVAHAGADQTIEVDTVLTFDGSASTDNDAIANYTWTFTYDADLITLFGVRPSFVFDLVGNYTVTLTVNDFATPANTGLDTLQVIVKDKTEFDADGDGMPDYWEAQYQLDMNDPADAAFDPDVDELTNLEEYENGTDPKNSDSDGDQLPDNWELDNNLDPNDDGTINENNGASGDPDGDGHSNLDEFEHGTDPQDSTSHPKDVEEDDEDYMQYIIIMIIVIIILVIILGLAFRKPVSEKELLAAEEEEEMPGEEAGMEAGPDAAESPPPAPPLSEGGFECPTCGALLTEADTICPECGEEFEDEEE